MSDPFKVYLRALHTALAAGNATEQTHRPALKTLLESLGEGITATNEPKQVTDLGKPDMVVLKGAVHLGYLETKDVGKNLDAEERTEQVRRYLKGLPNFILTDYLEFRWYVNGERRERAVLGHLDRDGKVKARKEDVAAVRSILEQFLSHQAPAIGTARDLALRMAGLAHLMREAALKTLETEGETGTLNGWLTAFEKTLLPHLPKAEFADMYAQTLTYGLFAARVTVGTGQELRRDTVALLLPETNPFLKKLFYHLAGPQVPPTVSWVIDDLISVLNAADLETVLAEFGKGSLEKDPVVHFYETFLAAYDPEKRKIRGVYYTPEPVVSYIVRAIDHILKETFGRPWGLADTNTLILDPACGTGTFLHAVIALIYETLCAQGQEGAWPGEYGYVSKNLLPRLFGFELLMAPYAVAHLKLGLALKDRGYDFPSGKRLGVYLTNTLEEPLGRDEKLLGPLGYITEESNTAATIKKDEPIEIILGNPPYAGHSANASYRLVAVMDKKTGEIKRTKDGKVKIKKVRTWIGRLIEDYKRVDGQPLGEKNPKWLQDDYVKFWRWGQWRIEKTGQGILAMITNHAYLDNPTFRGMRQALMQTFNQIYLMNLHGNARKKEVCPDGSPDENVFDIQQGVAIGIFVKREGGPAPARVWYADLWGFREAKYQTLAEWELHTTPWQEVKPNPPFYLFVPQIEELRDEYERGFKLTDIFKEFSLGCLTKRDNLVIDFERNELENKIQRFIDKGKLDKEISSEFKLKIKDKDKWSLPEARKSITNNSIKNYIRNISFRPFDKRYIFYHERYVARLNRRILGNFDYENIGLICIRQLALLPFNHVWITNIICDQHIISTRTKEGGVVFPLYIYHSTSSNLFVNIEPIKDNNFNNEFINSLSGKLILSFVSEGNGDLTNTYGPLDVFYYIYAILHSPIYRRRYAEFLKYDFPRLPLITNKNLFGALVKKGAELAALHLMESPALENLITRFPVSGSQVVERIRYDEGHRRVYINADQYFEGVPPDVWAFTIGGYQVCDKWLKDRKGRTLSFADIQHYQKIVKALAETIRLMAEIDAVIDAYGGWPIDRAS